MEENVFDPIAFVDEESGKRKAPPVSVPAKKVKTGDLIARFEKAQKKIGIRLIEIPEEEIFDSENNLRENIYYEFWSHVAGMFRSPNNRVLFLLDPIHYNLTLDDFDGVQRKLEEVRANRTSNNIAQSTIQKRLREAEDINKRLNEYSRHIDDIQKLHDTGAKLMREYKKERLREMFTKARTAVKSLPIMFQNNQSTKQVYDIAKELAKTLGDDDVLEGFKENEFNTLSDDSVVGIYNYILWTLAENYRYMYTARDDSFVPYPTGEELFDRLQFPPGIVQPGETTKETKEKIFEILENSGLDFTYNVRASRTRIRKFFENNRGIVRKGKKYVFEPTEITEPTEATDESMVDESMVDESSIDEEYLTGEKWVDSLSAWLIGYEETRAIFDRDAGDAMEQFENLVEEQMELFKKEAELAEKAREYREKTSVRVGRNDYLVVKNEFKTALERAYTNLTSSVKPLMPIRNKTVRVKSLMLDKRINLIVARLVGLYYLEHFNIFQPKQWTPVRTIQDTTRESLTAVTNISRILGNQRYNPKLN